MASAALPDTAAPPPVRHTAGFDPRDLASTGLVSRLIAKILEDPRWLFRIIRRLAPVLIYKNWALLSRYGDVVAALDHDMIVAVPFGPKVEALNDGPNFLLGMANDPEYQWLHKATLAVFPFTDNPAIVAPLALRHATAIIDASGGKLDAVQNLITLVPTRICEDYYGLTIPDEVAFGKWTIAMSTYMFGDPGNNPRTARCALAAGAMVRPLVDAAIANARANPDGPDTIAARLVKAEADDPRMTDPYKRAVLVGMITGFIPTNTMAAGHILEMLLRRPDFLAAARVAANAGDDDLLGRCLFEAMRFMPLNPGPFRMAAADYAVGGKTIRKGANILVGTQSAMFDPAKIEQPDVFDPNRPKDNYLLFGWGLHWCIGEPLARAQITQTLKPLLQRRNLRRAAGAKGHLGKFGPFPAHLEVEFDS